MALDTLDLAAAAQLPPYDDDEEIELMDTDVTNLQTEEQFIDTNKNTDTHENKEKDDDNHEMGNVRDELPSLLVIEKLKVYIRDGPNSHHVETIPVDEKCYELPTVEQLTSIKITEDEVKDIWQSLNLTKEDFRTLSTPYGVFRPESIYVRGVTNMSTQEILNCFEEFEPIGIEWICDHSCNVFWYDSLMPIHLLATKTKPGPCISHRRPTDFDHAMRLKKRKSSLTSTNIDSKSADIALPPGNWREGIFSLVDKSELSAKFYFRYTALNDRKVRGAENQSEYYRQHGNPNYNNMTGLISRSKKRALNAMKSNRFRDFTIIKSNALNSNSTSVLEDIAATATTTEDNTIDAKVKFTVVLPPKKVSPDREEEDNVEEQHRSKRQRQRSWDEDVDHQRREKPHFTVTIDSASKHSQYTRHKKHETFQSKKHKDESEERDSTPITDARQILERKRRNRQ